MDSTQVKTKNFTLNLASRSQTPINTQDPFQSQFINTGSAAYVARSPTPTKEYTLQRPATPTHRSNQRVVILQPQSALPQQNATSHTMRSAGAQSQPLFATQTPPRQKTTTGVQQSPIRTLNSQKDPIYGNERQPTEGKQQLQPKQQQSYLKSLEQEENLEVEEVGFKKSTKNLCAILLPLVVSIFFICGGIYLIHEHSELEATSSLKGADNVLAFVFENLDAGGLTYLTQTTALSNACQAGTQTISIGNWFGVKSGCLCLDSPTSGLKVYDFSHCYTLGVSNTCKSATRSSLQQLQVFANVRYCAQVVPSTAWSVAFAATSSYTKQCASDLYVTASQQCPDNTITTVGSQALSDSVSNLFNAGSTQASAGTTISAGDSSGNEQYYTLSYSNTQDRPIVALSYSSGNSLCLNNAEKAFAYSDQQSYPLFQQAQVGCDSLFGALPTKYVQVLGAQSLSTFYTQNGLQQLLNDEPYFSQFAPTPADTVNLLAVRKLQISSACAQFDRTVFSTAAQGAALARQLLQVYAIVLLATAGIVLLLGLFVIALLNSTRPAKTKLLAAQVYVISSFTAAIFAIIGATYYYIAIENQQGNAANTLVTYSKANCFDVTGINTAIDLFSQHHAATAAHYALPIYILGGGAIAYLLFWLALWALFKN